MKYVIIAGAALILMGCAKFSIDNPNPYSVYTYGNSDCCQPGNSPRR